MAKCTFQELRRLKHFGEYGGTYSKRLKKAKVWHSHTNVSLAPSSRRLYLPVSRYLQAQSQKSTVGFDYYRPSNKAFYTYRRGDSILALDLDNRPVHRPARGCIVSPYSLVGQKTLRHKYGWANSTTIRLCARRACRAKH